MRYICTAVVATLVLVGTSFAATINVPGDYATIQGAINASVNGDVINIAPGTYYQSEIDPDGKAITIQGTLNKDESLATTIDAQQDDGVFTITSGEGDGTVIKDLEITGGKGLNEGWGTVGGGIYLENSSPIIIGCTISGNTANYGGGICCNNSSPTISSGSFICGNDPNQIEGSYTASGSCIEESCDTCAVDSDADGVPDYLDQCPGYDDNADADGDGTPDDCDTCPEDPLNTDTDSDGTPDCIDGCPEDPLKTEPGMCGCGTAETNVNGDVDCDGDYDIDDIYAGMADFGIDNGPAGACCVGSGCDSITEESCASLGGTWLAGKGGCDDCPATCNGDLNADGVVDVNDLLALLALWGACP